MSFLFTNKIKVWYNLTVKKFVILTISSLIALSSLGGTHAFAAEDTVYPKDEDFIKTLTFASLNDYAAGGGAYAFAEGREICVYDNGNIANYAFDRRITALDYAEGKFYCEAENGAVYSLPYALGDKSVEYEMPEEQTTVVAGDFVYKLIGTSIQIAEFNLEGTSTIHTVEGEYSRLKIYDGAVYAMSGATVYEFDGAERKNLNLEYADYTATQDIKTGQAPALLKNYSAPVFVDITEGAHLTEVDLTEVGEVFKTGVTVSAKKEAVALLLCYTGNAAVISMGGQSYLLLKSNVTETATVRYSKPEYEYGRITTGDGIYSAPYMCGGTKIADAAGATVKVLNKVEFAGILLTPFYEVEFETANGTNAKGYVAEAFLTKTDYVKEDDKKPTEFPDPDYSEASNTPTVLIIFAVVILVLLAVGYLAFTATSDKRKKEKKRKDAPKEENK